MDPNYVESYELVDGFPYFLNRLNVVPFPQKVKHINIDKHDSKKT